MLRPAFVDFADEEAVGPLGYNCLKDHGADDEDNVATVGNQYYIVVVVDIRGGGLPRVVLAESSNRID